MTGLKAAGRGYRNFHFPIHGLIEFFHLSAVHKFDIFYVTLGKGNNYIPLMRGDHHFTNPIVTLDSKSLHQAVDRIKPVQNILYIFPMKDRTGKQQPFTRHESNGPVTTKRSLYPIKTAYRQAVPKDGRAVKRHQSLFGTGVVEQPWH